jgi:hypothetical protein
MTVPMQAPLIWRYNDTDIEFWKLIPVPCLRIVEQCCRFPNGGEGRQSLPPNGPKIQSLFI